MLAVLGEAGISTNRGLDESTGHEELCPLCGVAFGKVSTVGLSSNTLMHFTKTPDALYGILSEGFKVKHCRETFRLEGRYEVLHVPMISFCDIPFSQIVNHVNSYGHYGIGLTKAWAIDNRLNPVLYIQSDSHIAESYNRLITDLNTREGAGSLDKEPRKMAKDLARYIKNYEGPLTVDGIFNDRYRFSDEREWRYVPPLSDDYPMMYTEQKFKAKGKDLANRPLEHIRLKFKLDEVKYIVIRDDSEIGDLIRHIDKVRGSVETKHQVERVTTRILTLDQIKGDF